MLTPTARKNLHRPKSNVVARNVIGLEAGRNSPRLDSSLTVSIILLMTTFPERLKTVRELRGLTCRALSKRIEAADSTVGQLERGDIPNPGAKTVVALARELAVSTDWLLTGEGEGPANDAATPNEAA